MIDDIIVLDNVVPVAYQDFIEKSLLGELAAPWFLVDDITYNKSTNQNISSQTAALVHSLKADNRVNSQVYNITLPVVFLSLEKINYKYMDVLMAKSFLQFPSTESGKNNIHVDWPQPHVVCLYYVNDSDGDTTIYKQTINDVPYESINKTEFTVKKVISPKKGRVVLFDGKYYHCSSNPTINRRCIINFDVV
jgi:hypothetical protein